MLNYYCSSLKNIYEFNEFIYNIDRSKKNELEKYINEISYKIISLNRIKDNYWTIIPVLRSGLSMLHAATSLLNYKSVCFLNAKRNKDLYIDVDMQWLSKIDMECNDNFYILDPIIATGSTIMKVCYDLEKRFPKSNIHIASLYSSMEGINEICSKFYNVKINTYAISDSIIDGFLLPRTNGDLGDKLFGDNK